MSLSTYAPTNYAPPFGQGDYGLPRVYGVEFYAAYTVEPIGSAQNFTANSSDYETILIQWSQPQVPANLGITITDYRLLSNRYGFPVDQNDGNILLDSPNYFGNQYKDQDVIPGTMHYYGFYLLLSNGVWVRAGLTACLAINNYGSGQWLFDLLPYYFQSTSDIDLTMTQTGDTYLSQYLDVIGWGLDYLKTQYDFEYTSLNNPMLMSLRDVYALASEFGIPFQPEMPAAIMRKAVANWTTVSQQRGTLTGVGNVIELITGYTVDVQLGVNKFLENDQSGPFSPGYGTWNAEKTYAAASAFEKSGNYIYKPLVLSLDEAPTNTTSTNTWWSCLQDAADPNNTLNNTNSIGVPTASGGNNTGTANTLEAIYEGQAVSYVPPASGTLTVGLGEPTVANTAVWQGYTFRVTNQAATSQTMWLRTVSRATTDLSTANWVPDAQQVIENGIPVPQLTARNEWSATTRYATHALVTWNNMLFQAQRASTNAQPPIVGQAINTNPFFRLNAVNGWTYSSGYGFPTISTTVTSVSGISFYGASVLTLPVTSSTVNPTMTSNSIPVIPGALYNITFWVQSAATLTNAGQISVVWNGPAGLTSTTTGSLTTISSTVNTFTQVTYTVNAPSFATSASAILTLNHSFSGSATIDIANATFACYATPEWTPISKDGRLRYMFSAYCSQSLLVGSNKTTAMTPFVEWYSPGGNLIQRVICRTPTAGTPAPPNNLSYDSFTTQPGSPLTGRTLDSDDTQWSSVEGEFFIGGFDGGCAYPVSPTTPTMALITGTANGYVAATYDTVATSPLEWSLIFRYSSTGNYFHAGPTQLYICASGTFTSLGTYSQALQVGDRLYVEMNGSTITIFRNQTQVLQVTNSNYSSATKHGIANETP